MSHRVKFSDNTRTGKRIPWACDFVFWSLSRVVPRGQDTGWQSCLLCVSASPHNPDKEGEREKEWERCGEVTVQFEASKTSRWFSPVWWRWPWWRRRAAVRWWSDWWGCRWSAAERGEQTQAQGIKTTSRKKKEERRVIKYKYLTWAGLRLDKPVILPQGYLFCPLKKYCPQSSLTYLHHFVRLPHPPHVLLLLK